MIQFQLFEDMNNKITKTRPIKGEYDVINACPNCKTDAYLKDL